MKKQITLAIMMLGIMVLPCQAQYLMTKEENTALNNQIKRAAANQTKIQATLTVEIPITKQYLTGPSHSKIDFTDSAYYRTLHHTPTYQSTVGCKAYALDDHWLIAGAACLWNGRHTVNMEGKNYLTGLVEEDYSKVYLEVDGIQVPMSGNLFVEPRFTLLPHVLLVRVPQDSELADVVKTMPKIHILSLSRTNPLDLKNGNFYVNTSRFGLDASRLRRLDSYNAATTTVTIRENFDDLASLANDPLLYVSQDTVYWIGVNKGIMVTLPNRKWDGQPSKNFVMFNNWDINFIQRTITQQDPAAWPRIAAQLHKDM